MALEISAHPAHAALPQPAPAAAVPFRSMRAADVATASLLLALGVVVIAAAVDMGTGWGSDGPESGFVPFWLAIVLVACSGGNVVRALRRSSGERFASRGQLGSVAKVLLPAGAMIALTPFAGLYVSGAVYMGFTMRWTGRHSWALSIALPLVLTVVVFLVFERWFLVPLPKGPLETWLGY